MQHGIRLSEHLDGDGETIFRHACALGAEGIVAKLRDRPYRSGRGTHHAFLPRVRHRLGAWRRDARDGAAIARARLIDRDQSATRFKLTRLGRDVLAAAQAAGQRTGRVMPRDGSLTPRDLVGKLDVLAIECEKFGH